MRGTQTPDERKEAMAIVHHMQWTVFSSMRTHSVPFIKFLIALQCSQSEHIAIDGMTVP